MLLSVGFFGGGGFRKFKIKAIAIGGKSIENSLLSAVGPPNRI